MQVFPRETTDYIAAQLEDYFRRKREKTKMSYRDAATLVDYVSGPASAPGTGMSID